MNNAIKTLATALVLGLSLGAQPVTAQECQPKHVFKPIKAGTLTVALTNTPPYSLERNQSVAGIDGDLVNAFAEENCLTVAYSIFTYPAAVAAVQSGRADVAIGGFYRTVAREKVVTLSSAVYLDQLAVESKDGLDTVDALLGKKVGTVEGYLWVSDMENIFKGARTYPSSLNLAQDVQAGRLDAGLEGFGAAVTLLKGTDFKVKLLKPDPRIPATTLASQTSFLLPKENKDLTTAVDATLSAFRANGTIVKALEAYGLPASAADVGEMRVIE